MRKLSLLMAAALLVGSASSADAFFFRRARAVESPSPVVVVWRPVRLPSWAYAVNTPNGGYYRTAHSSSHPLFPYVVPVRPRHRYHR
jgi:hypothetical protein